MNRSYLSLAIAGLLSTPVPGIEVIAPNEPGQSAIEVSTPDARVKTLGKIQIHIDLAASHDDLLDLKIRRSGLTMPDGLPFRAFGAHKESGIIVLASGPVRSLSIASVKGMSRQKETLVLFHGGGGQIIAPAKDDLAVFDLDFQPLPFTYEPLAPPGSTRVPVNILLDASGSMAGHMDMVAREARAFMRQLPEFTRCTVTIFNHALRLLGSSDPAHRPPCPQSAGLLNAPIHASGRTALFEALERGMSGTLASSASPVITVAVTDGMNTEPYAGTLETLKVQKEASGAKLFVFWAGNYEPDHLQGLADLEFVSTDDLKIELERFFRSLGISLSGLQSLLVQTR